MTDTQVMAALEPTQADIEMAETICNKKDNPHMWAILCKKFAKHRIASSPAAEPVADSRSTMERLADILQNSSYKPTPRYLGAAYLGYDYARRLYATPITAPAVDAELRKALEPFSALADAVLSEAPADADEIIAFTDCTGKRHAITMDQFRAVSSTLATPPSVPAQGEREWDGHLTAEEQAMIDAA